MPGEAKLPLGIIFTDQSGACENSEFTAPVSGRLLDATEARTPLPQIATTFQTQAAP
jgi:hypothetical protein